MVFSVMVGTNTAINHVAARTVTQCDCGNSSCQGGCSLLARHKAKRACRSCDNNCGCVQCPSCEDQICRLELDQSKVKKTCFKVEQKPICIPPVRFPWQRDCPPGISKTKLVKVLSKHTYECPNCTYKWVLQECEPPQVPSTTPLRTPSTLPTPAPVPVPVPVPVPAAATQTSVVPAPPIFEVYRPGTSASNSVGGR